MENDKLILETLAELKVNIKNIESEVKEVRQTDIPRLQVEMAVGREKVRTQQKVTSAVVLGTSSVIAAAISSAFAWFK